MGLLDDLKSNFSSDAEAESPKKDPLHPALAARLAPGLKEMVTPYLTTDGRVGQMAKDVGTQVGTQAAGVGIQEATRGIPVVGALARTFAGMATQNAQEASREDRQVIEMVVKANNDAFRADSLEGGQSAKLMSGALALGDKANQQFARTHGQAPNPAQDQRVQRAADQAGQAIATQAIGAFIRNLRR